MAEEKDIRWIQRSKHFEEALQQLSKFVEKKELNELEEQGLIQAFEYTYELAWNTLKDYLEMQGETEIHGSRDTIRLAFRRGLIIDGETWMAMLKDRTLTTHTYNEDLAKRIGQSVLKQYYPEFVALCTRIQGWKEKGE
ncbi:MAG TPA: nucleotidyltransferase substrate binding protein [Spirochaetales bacterium]|nr:nucleotidyltransferase substrate binding protein [Spirochaetales bacterium]